MFTPRALCVEWVTIAWDGCPKSAPCMHHESVRGGSNGLPLAAKAGNNWGVLEFRRLR
jgi:hypothetical protein